MAAWSKDAAKARQRHGKGTAKAKSPREAAKDANCREEKQRQGKAKDNRRFGGVIYFIGN